MPDNKLATASLDRIAFIAVLILSAALLVVLHGFQTDIPRDNAIYLYSAIEATKGTPPYLSLFDIKTPLTSLYYTPAIALADLLNTDHLGAARLWSVATTSVSSGVVFLILRKLGFSVLVSVLAGLSLVAIPGFALQTVTGGRPKVLVVLLFLLNWYALLKDRPLWAGIAAGCAALTWQPAGILAVATFVAYLTQKRFLDSARVVGGGVIAGALVLTYFILEHALYAFLEGALLVHLNYLERSAEANLIGNIKTFIYNMPHLYGGLLIIGLLSPLALLPGVIRAHRVQWVFLLITFTGFFLWTLSDNQGYPDLFWLIPFSAVALALLLQHLLQGLGSAKDGGASPISAVQLSCAGLLGGSLLLSVYYASCGSCTAVLEQNRASVDAVMAEALPQDILTIDAPDFLVLAGISDPNRHMVINSGVDKYLEATQPGGFRGWFDRLYASAPAYVIVGEIEGTHVHYVRDTLERDCKVIDTASWTIWQCSREN